MQKLGIDVLGEDDDDEDEEEESEEDDEDQEDQEDEEKDDEEEKEIEVDDEYTDPREKTSSEYAKGDSIADLPSSSDHPQASSRSNETDGAGGMFGCRTQ